MFRYLIFVSSIGKEKEKKAEEHGKSVKVLQLQVLYTPILQDFLEFFSDIISFQLVLHFDVDKSEVEWNLNFIL